MCIPFFLKKGEIPKNLPSGLEKEVKILSKTKSKLECLKKAFKFICDNFYGKSILFFLKFPRLFVADVFKLWNFRFGVGDGFLHCTQHNFLLRILLIKSKKFSEEDIRLIDYVRRPFGFHQLLQVNVGGRWIDVDTYFFHSGFSFGSSPGKWFVFKIIV
ncbi:hypothetical protein DRJ22_02085 [Candidatus Woesearchaeota archaeon]|nr:MAG: hypothetical protein B6U93_03525 [Candidatus Woesearchaeota archaeon ex4484_78]RLE46382.1 MAG: hypothetical protein DRJ22_02085 [Candidatus Woesearchaeota archaeon]